MADQEHKVYVQLERGDDHKITRVTITPDNIRLEDGDWVRWTFDKLEGNEFGFISFAQQYPRFGPFSSIRTFSSNSVLAKGNKGNSGTFIYTALILDIDNEHALASTRATVENTTSTRNTAPNITVTYCDDLNPPYLKVEPYDVGLNTGDTVTWHFRKLPANAFACFRFPDKKLGPFVAFNADRGDDSCTVEASGTGFALNAPVGTQYTYHIELRNWEGTRLASHDPMIANLGPPLG